MKKLLKVFCITISVLILVSCSTLNIFQEEQHKPAVNASYPPPLSNNPLPSSTVTGTVESTTATNATPDMTTNQVVENQESTPQAPVSNVIPIGQPVQMQKNNSLTKKSINTHNSEGMSSQPDIQ